ncbi:MAG: AAA family ATPase [Solirubrobacteraceae bacterium]
MQTQDAPPKTGTAAPRSTALHGRSDEHERIDCLVRGAPPSRSAVLMLRGPAGIGKSALLEEARLSAADLQVLACHGTEAETRLPYAALDQLLRPVLDHPGAIPDIQARALRCALGLEFGSRPEPFLVALAVLSVLAEAADARPVLCVIDDAQWLDEATADTLLFVARRLEAESIAMLFAAREEPDERLEAPGLASCASAGSTTRRPTRSSSARAAGRSPRTSPSGWSMRRRATRSPCSSSPPRSPRDRPQGSSRSSDRCPSARTSSARSSSGCGDCRPPASGCCSSPPPTRAVI